MPVQTSFSLQLSSAINGLSWLETLGVIFGLALLLVFLAWGR